MRIFRSLAEVPPDFGPSIVSIGNFDGVHLAHARVVRSIVSRAKASGAQSLVVTFDPHPARVLKPDATLKLLTPTPVKLKLLAAMRLDAALVLPFARDLSLMSPHDFLAEILQDKLRAREVHEGFNFRFGHKAAGDIGTLRNEGRDLGFEVFEYPEMRAHGESVSSSNIRRLLYAGKVGRARQLLGRAFSIVSTPGRGRGYGSKYTVPTINLSRYDELIPQIGVYVTRVRVGEECFDAVTNAGNRPTFGRESFAVESHLLNFHPIVLESDTEIELHFLHRLRDEMAFPSPEALRAQIMRDAGTAQKLFRRLSQPAS